MSRQVVSVLLAKHRAADFGVWFPHPHLIRQSSGEIGLNELFKRKKNILGATATNTSNTFCCCSLGLHSPPGSINQPRLFAPDRRVTLTSAILLRLLTDWRCAINSKPCQNPAIKQLESWYLIKLKFHFCLALQW